VEDHHDEEMENAIFKNPSRRSGHARLAVVNSWLKVKTTTQAGVIG